MINLAELARDCDISSNTAKGWLSILQTSYINTLPSPYDRNFNKHMIKSPKLYFYDTGIVCNLLGIKSKGELFLNPPRGHIFETFIINKIIKNRYNKIKNPNVYYWRDVQGHEVDCLFEQSYEDIIPIEIKASKTISDALLKGLTSWQAISGTPQGYVIYGGDKDLETKKGKLISWQNVEFLLNIFSGR